VFDDSGRHLFTSNTMTGATSHEFAYDTAGRLSTVTDGDGNITTIERATDGNPTGIVGPFAQRTVLTVDANGHLETVVNPAGETIRLVHNSGGLLTSFTDRRGNKSTFTYDPTNGRLVLDEDAAGGSQKLVRLDSNGAYTVTRTTGAERSVTYQTSKREDGGEDRIITGANGLVSTMSRIGSATKSAASPNGMQQSWQPSPDPRFGLAAPLVSDSKVTLPSGLVSTSSMSRSVILADPENPFRLSTLTKTVTLNGRVYVSNFDGGSNTFTYTTPKGRTSTLAIDTQGRPLSRTIPDLAPSAFTYDSRGRLIRAVAGSDPDSRSTELTYNAQGYTQSITDPIGRQIQFTRDNAGRVTTTTLPGARSVGFGYDANGNVTSITPPGKPSHGLNYTEVNLLHTYVAPDVGDASSTTGYTYNLDRQLTSIARPDGKNVDFAYDSAGRKRAITIARGEIRFAYDSATGNLASIAAPRNQGLAFSYDGSLRTVETWTGPIAGKVKRSFDADLRVKGISVNDKPEIPVTYDEDGLVIGAGDLILARSATHGLLTGSTLHNSIDTWSYNIFGEPTEYTASVNTDTAFKTIYTRDQLGRITQMIEMIGGAATTYDYTYNVSGRLVEIKKDGQSTDSFSYDENGNRITYTNSNGSVAGTYDAQDRLKQYGSNSYDYTASGELKSKTVNGLQTIYDYDALGNLISVGLPSGTEIGYIVDGRNRRVGKTRNGQLVSRLLYQDGLRAVAELDSGGNIASRFVYAGDTVPAYMIRARVTYRLVTDMRGSVRLVLNAVTGAIAQRIDYDSFGNVLQDTNPGFQPFGFAGGLYDRDTKLIRFGVRDYDPQTGRWTAKDPIGFRGGSLNLYAYAGNDPINFRDPRGLAYTWSDLVSDAKSVWGTLKEATNYVYEKVKEGKEWIDKTFEVANDAVEVRESWESPKLGDLLDIGKVLSKYLPWEGGACVAGKAFETAQEAPGAVQANQRQGETGTIHHDWELRQMHSAFTDDGRR
jgi:RHS repeat-associated protein